MYESLGNELLYVCVMCVKFNLIKIISLTMLILPLLLRGANLVLQFMYSTVSTVPIAFAVDMGRTSTSKYP